MQGTNKDIFMLKNLSNTSVTFNTTLDAPIEAQNLYGGGKKILRIPALFLPVAFLHFSRINLKFIFASWNHQNSCNVSEIEFPRIERLHEYTCKHSIILKLFLCM